MGGILQVLKLIVINPVSRTVSEILSLKGLRVIWLETPLRSSRPKNVSFVETPKCTIEIASFDELIGK